MSLHETKAVEGDLLLPNAEQLRGGQRVDWL